MTNALSDQPGAGGGPAPKIKWSYMDRWTMRSPKGWVTPQHGPQYADRFYRQLAGIGFQGVGPFEFRLMAQAEMFGSAKKALEFAQDRGVERFVNQPGQGGRP